MTPETNAETLSLQERVEHLLQQMTLAEKIGQMTQVDKGSITPEQVAERFIGSVLSGGGGSPTPNTPGTWRQMVVGFQEAALQTRLGIPLLYGTDSVHGHNNVKGAVIFPHNVGLGATRDADLVERIGQITALETLATGANWSFAPTVAVSQDIRWGRTYEAYGADTDLVAELGAACVRGLQTPLDVTSDGSRALLASVKHYLADGGTGWGTTSKHDWLNWWPLDTGGATWMLDQGNADIDEETLRAAHLPPYQAAIAAGALNIMVSYSSWRGLKMHAHKYLLTDVLKGELGFQGFLISDYLAIDQLSPDYYTCVTMSINAGLDMIMVPMDYERFITTLTQAVENGDVPMDRIDDAARRILRVKLQLGLFERPLSDEALLNLVGSDAHRAVAREAVRKSLVLLKNVDGLLPLSKAQNILIAGQAADDIGLQCGGWSIEWMGSPGNITPGTTILEGIRQAVDQASRVVYHPQGEFAEDSTPVEVGLVVIAEEPYAEGGGDCSDLNLPPDDIALIERVRQQCQKLIIILLSGRPRIITDQLEQGEAFIAAWLPGTEGNGIADVLFGDYAFTGKLPHSWPRSMDQVPLAALRDHDQGPLFPIGHGLT